MQTSVLDSHNQISGHGCVRFVDTQVFIAVRIRPKKHGTWNMKLGTYRNRSTVISASRAGMYTTEALSIRRAFWLVRLW